MPHKARFALYGHCHRGTQARVDVTALSAAEMVNHVSLEVAVNEDGDVVDPRNCGEELINALRFKSTDMLEKQ